MYNIALQIDFYVASSGGQILYELNAGGVDERRLVDVQLQRMADGDERENYF